ncbi:MAG: PAS domain S-box protein [Granulosicoccus sp.]
MNEHAHSGAGHDGAGHAQILDQVGVAVITIDHAGIILDTNISSAVMFGHSADAMLGQNVSMLMPGHHAKRHNGYLHHHLSTGEHRIIGKGRLVEGKRSDGTVFPMHLAVGRLEVDGEIYFKGIIHDLSVQDRLQDQATRLGKIVDESINEIFVFKTDTLQFTLVNRGAMNNLGYSLSEFTQMTPVDIKPQFDENGFRKLIAPLISGELEQLTLQTVHRRKDGSEYDADIVLHLSDAVAPPEFVAIVQDSTEKNAMFQAVSQAQKMESIGQLTGGIAHDFNNLLTIISGNLELLNEMITATDQLELVDEALSASERGADLTNRLLSFARRGRLLPEKLNLNDIVKELSDLLRRTLSENISLQLLLAPHLWDVKVDRSQIDSALMNLAINARDAMCGKGALTVTTDNRSLSTSDAEPLNLVAGNYAVLSVTDSGTGISADQLQRVFEPFFTTKSESKGHGLGLSMVYGFAQQSGGSVSVKSTEGDGASFSLYLPRDWSPESEAKQSNLSNALKPRDHYRILLVEDDDSVRRLTIRRLEHMGHTVQSAGNAGEAVALMENQSVFDLVITDIVMPGAMDGVAFAKFVHEKKPAMPIILCTGFSKKLLSLDDSQRKAFHILHKPYSLTELENIVSTAVYGYI